MSRYLDRSESGIRESDGWKKKGKEQTSDM